MIDGFNFYHRIENHYKSTGQNLKWLNYRSLAQMIVGPEASLEKILFFTAPPTHLKNPSKLERHSLYIRALNSVGVEVIQGNFKRKTFSAKIVVSVGRPEESIRIEKYEEKETDVNIAITLIEQAFKDQFDHCLLFSVDTDLAPAVKMLKSNFGSSKRVTIVKPPGFSKYYGLLKIYNKAFELKIHQLVQHQFPQEIHTKRGIIRSPYE